MNICYELIAKLGRFKRKWLTFSFTKRSRLNVTPKSRTLARSKRITWLRSDSSSDETEPDSTSDPSTRDRRKLRIGGWWSRGTTRGRWTTGRSPSVTLWEEEIRLGNYVIIIFSWNSGCRVPCKNSRGAKMF